MRWTRWIAFTACLAALVAAASLLSCANQTTSGGAMSPADKVARGHYLVMASGCGDCHTPGTFYGAPDTTRWLAGSEIGWQGPWGVSYAQNLTPDSTGIGAWTEDQIAIALKNGQRPDGTPLLPPMPWTAYTNYTDDDLHAIAAYLKSIPAIVHVNPAQIPPGAAVSGSIIVFPPPPAWDAKNLPPPPTSGGPPPAGGAPSGK